MKRHKSKSFFLFLTMLISIIANSHVAAGELTFPQDDNSFVIDDADVLSDNEESNLEQISQSLSDEWGSELVVVIINSTNDYSTGEDINGSLAYFAVKLFDKWGVGDEVWRDGVLLVLAVDQSGTWEWRYEAGLFWDGTGTFSSAGLTAGSDFDAQTWYAGLEILMGDIASAADEYWTANDGFVSPPGTAESSSSGSIIAALFCLAFAVLGIFAVIVLFRGGTLTSGPGYQSGPGVYRPWYRRRYWGGHHAEMDHHHHHYQPHSGGHSHQASGSFQSRKSTQASPRSTSSRSSSKRGSGSRRRVSSRSSRSSGSGGRRGGGRRGSS